MEAVLIDARYGNTVVGEAAQTSWDRPEPWLEAFRALTDGQTRALGTLYDLAAARLFGLALWRTGSREDASDVVQEAFVRVAEQRGELRHVRDPRWWLLALTHRIAVDVVRRRQRRKAEPLEEHPYLEAPAGDHDRALDAARIGRLVGALSAPQREVVYLRHYAGMSFAEIGDSLGIPTFTAASRYRLALAALRKRLEVTS
jgi:RNA polymerase sigma factor (sigma-70 family)